MSFVGEPGSDSTLVVVAIVVAVVVPVVVALIVVVIVVVLIRRGRHRSVKTRRIASFFVDKNFLDDSLTTTVSACLT